MKFPGVFTSTQEVAPLAGTVRVWEGEMETEEKRVLLLAYQPENQRHLENFVRCTERLPILSETCRSIVFHNFSLTFEGKFYIAIDFLPKVLVSNDIVERRLIDAFEQVRKDLKLVKMHVSAIQKVIHGSIRPDNVYWDGEKIVLGPVKLPTWSIPPKNWVYTEEGHDADVRDLGLTFVSVLTRTNYQRVANNPFALELSQEASEFLSLCLGNRSRDSSVIFDPLQPVVEPAAIYFFSTTTLTAFAPSTRAVSRNLYTNPLGVGFSFCPISGSQLLITGGTNTQKAAFTLTTSDFTVTLEDDLLTPHCYHSMIEHQGDVWAIAGTSSQKCESFQNRQWTQREDLNFVRGACSLAVWNDVLYAVGGQENAVEKREAAGWVLVKTLAFRAESAAALFVSDEILLLFGGRYGSTYHETATKVDLRSGETTATDLSCTGLFGCNPQMKVGNSFLLISNRGKIFEFRDQSIEVLN